MHLTIWTYPMPSIKQQTEYDAAAISDTQPWQNMATTGKIGSSDLMMIKMNYIYISFRSPKLEWVSWTHTCIAKKTKKVAERTNYILGTLLTEYIQQGVINPSKFYTVYVQDI